MSTMILNIEKFNRSVNFGLWQVKMREILIQMGYIKPLNGMSEARWEDIDTKVLSAI